MLNYDCLWNMMFSHRIRRDTIITLTVIIVFNVYVFFYMYLLAIYRLHISYVSIEKETDGPFFLTAVRATHVAMRGIIGMAASDKKLIPVTSPLLLQSFAFFNRYGYPVQNDVVEPGWECCTSLSHFCICSERMRVFCTRKICVPCSYDRCIKCTNL